MNIPRFAYPSIWKHGLLLLLPPAVIAIAESSGSADLVSYDDVVLITMGSGFFLSLLLHALRFITKVSDQADHPFLILARWFAIIGQAALSSFAMAMGVEVDGNVLGFLFVAILLLALAGWYVLVWIIRKFFSSRQPPKAPDIGLQES